MVAPGAMDLLDIAEWQENPERFAGRPFHEHNRLIKSAVFDAEKRRQWVRELALRFGKAKGSNVFLLPLRGIQEWDREGQDLRDEEAMAALVDEARKTIPGCAETVEVGAHINDPGFCDAVLEQFDRWVEEGTVSDDGLLG